MKYTITSTATINVADESTLKTTIEQIESFVEGKDGSLKFVIRTDDTPDEVPFVGVLEESIE